MRTKTIPFPLQRKLLLFFVSVLLMALLLSGVLVAQRYQKMFEESEHRLSEQMLQRMSGSLEQYLSDLDQFSIDTILHPSILHVIRQGQHSRFIGPHSESRFLHGLFGIDWQTSRNIFSFHVSDLEGHNVLSTGTMLQKAEQRDLQFLAQGDVYSRWDMHNEVYPYALNAPGLRVVSYYRKVLDPETYRPIGALCIDLLPAAFEKRLEGLDWADGMSIMLTDELGKTIYETHMTTENDAFYTTLQPLSNGWSLAVSLPAPAGSAQAASLREYQTIVLCISAVCSMLLIFLISQLVSRPLSALVETMEKVKYGHLDVRAHLNSHDEIALLANSFNDMLDRIHDLMEKNRSIEKAERQAEINYLQTQMSPHFIYNSLDMIRWEARKGKNDVVEEQIQALSRLLRGYLHMGEDYVEFSDELQYLQDYMTLMRHRFGPQIQFELDVSQVPPNCYVLKMLLQPLLENAITHGLKDDDDGGIIFLSGHLEPNVLVLSVRDNGKGAVEDQLRQLSACPQGDGKGLALWNIQNRIKLHYGAGFGLTFSSSLGQGTCVTLRLPFMERVPQSPSLDTICFDAPTDWRERDHHEVADC